MHIEATPGIQIDDDDYDMRGLSPIVEQSEEDGYSIASEIEEPKKPIVSHVSFMYPVR